MRTDQEGRASRAEQVDHRRAELLEAARRVVLDRGLANTRVADIAKATDVSGGLIHYHFATKDILLTEMLRAATSDDIRGLREIADGPGSPLERLDRIIRYCIPVSRKDQSWILWIDAWGFALREPALSEILTQLDGAWMAAIEEVIMAGIADGSFVCEDPAGAAERLDALLDGLAVRFTLHPKSPSRARILDHARRAAAQEVGLAAEDFGISRS